MRFIEEEILLAFCEDKVSRLLFDVDVSDKTAVGVILVAFFEDKVPLLLFDVVALDDTAVDVILVSLFA